MRLEIKWIGRALATLPMLPLMVGFVSVSACEYDCWDQGGGASVISAT